MIRWLRKRQPINTAHLYWCEQVRSGRVPFGGSMVDSPQWQDYLRRKREAPTLMDAYWIEFK